MQKESLLRLPIVDSWFNADLPRHASNFKSFSNFPYLLFMLMLLDFMLMIDYNIDRDKYAHDKRKILFCSPSRMNM